jgi:hypothetical protein
MTAQISDILYFDGDEYLLYCEPLEDFFEQNPPRPDIEATYTACWRGYVAVWCIKRSRLYLNKITNFDGKILNLKKTLFPNEEGPVFASWFTGSLICPNGPEVNYVHMGYETTYEKYLIIEIERGNLIDVKDLSLAQYKEWCRTEYSYEAR